MPSVKNYVYPIPMTSIDSATFSGSYQAINSTGIPQSCFLLKVVNNSNQLVTISWNGTTDHDIAPSTSAYVYDYQTNKQPNNDMALAQKGQIIYAKGTAGVGLVYLVGFYNPIAS